MGNNEILKKLNMDNWLESLDKELEELPAKHNNGENIVYLLIDCSSSMDDGVKIIQAREGAKGFVAEAIQNGFSVGLIAFSCDVSLVLEPTNNLPRISRCLTRLTPVGSTNLTGALVLAQKQFSNSPWKGQIVIATDGMPNNPHSALDEARKLKDRGIEIITIGTDGADYEFLKQISSRTDFALSTSQQNLGSTITSAAKLLPMKTR